ncbi:MAG: transposase [Pseudomonadota bacterium]|nr:transposase [Pseudomonadota bacterium]
MAREPRIHYPGALYHVMLRGNGGQDIFLSDSDRTRFFLLIQEGVHRFGNRIHTFCFMDNHIHLAIQVADIPLSKIIQNISLRYTRWINDKCRKTGHLFQGRYKALLVDQDSYLLELVRYIHLNPIRAGLVKHPKNYKWSGHNCYLGEEKLTWLTTGWVLGQFGEDITTARHGFARFVNEGIGLLATQLETSTMTEVAEYFQRDISTLSVGIKRIAMKIKSSKEKTSPWSKVLQGFNVKL